MATNLW